eukprot:jgi/Chlat1/6023/Chrsp4S09084
MGKQAVLCVMGYAQPGQIARGLHLPLLARALIIQPDHDNHDNDKVPLLVHVVVDACMVFGGVKRAVLAKLGSPYADANVLLCATHTHASPGGYAHHTLYNVTTRGFCRDTFDAVVDGIVRSVLLARDNAVPGCALSLRCARVMDANANRSPTAYMLNPQQERARYPRDVDDEMVLLKAEDEDGKAMGCLSWFPVHCTSMRNTNALVSGDNKGRPRECVRVGIVMANLITLHTWSVAGYAAYLLERDYNGGAAGCRRGNGAFVGAFAQSNEGDVSPHIAGGRCRGSHAPCDGSGNNCNPTECVAEGPVLPDARDDGLVNTCAIGGRQYRAARALLDQDKSSGARYLRGGTIDTAHAWVDMTALRVDNDNRAVRVKGRNKRGVCRVIWESTTDGPGIWPFFQGDTQGRNPVLRLISWFANALVLRALPTPDQLVRVGPDLVIAAVPCEMTTMAGRRLREAIARTIIEEEEEEEAERGKGVRPRKPPVVVISGLANEYSGYCTTPEEYAAQRYEGASTLYGPHTLAAYCQEFQALARTLMRSPACSSTTGAPPPLPRPWSLMPPVAGDVALPWRPLGSVVRNARERYVRGERVEVEFVGAHPRNSCNRDDAETFVLVERLSPGQQGNDRTAVSDEPGASGAWVRVADDMDWETTFRWEQPFPGFSSARVTWEVPRDALAAAYRVRYCGHACAVLTRRVTPVQGCSRTFHVVDGVDL